MALTSMLASGCAVAVISCFAIVFIFLVYRRLKYDPSMENGGHNSSSSRAHDSGANSRTRLNQASGDSMTKSYLSAGHAAGTGAGQGTSHAQNRPLLNSSGGNFSNQSQYEYNEEGGGKIDAGNMTFPRMQQSSSGNNQNHEQIANNTMKFNHNDSLFQYYTLNKARVEKYQQDKEKFLQKQQQSAEITATGYSIV